jgi:hypothetical protein
LNALALTGGQQSKATTTVARIVQGKLAGDGERDAQARTNRSPVSKEKTT